MTAAPKTLDVFDPLNLGRFELHSLAGDGDAPLDVAASPWADERPAASKAEAAIAPEEGVVWLRLNKTNEGLSRTRNCGEAAAGFRVVRRRLGSALAMVVQNEGVLVNGAPALPLAVLSVKDSIVLGPGRHFYVTQRLKPYLGSPPQHVLNKPCPFCQIPIADDTRIYLCPCGAPYHYETAESHAHVGESERLNCFGKIEKCLACGRRLTLDEFLEWDPATL
jgi:hypothetical protein